MPSSSQPLYHDAAQPAHRRADDLLARMTLDEKLAQLGSLWIFELLDGATLSDDKVSQRLRQGIGHITRIGGASALAPAARAEVANRLQRFLVEQTRLGIPAIVHEECCSGYMAQGATLFPQAIGVASTWDAGLVEAMGDAIRQQMRAVGAHQALAPVLDVTRDPRWGRVEETFGEDPYLVACLGTAYVRGIQGTALSQGVVATGKHFAGYGFPEGGRNWAPALIPPRELREVVLMPFEAAVRLGGMASMMNGYQELDGVPCAASRELLTGILRQEWGFDGVVVADYFSVDMLASYHHVATDKSEAAALALLAGLDLELPSTDCYGDPLRRAVEQGAVGIELVNTAVHRVLTLKFRLGLFEQPYVDATRAVEVFDTAEQRALARRIAQQSIVLLKNDDNLLPLAQGLRSAALIGPNADTVRNLMGDYSYLAHVETLLEGDSLGSTKALPSGALQAARSPATMLTIRQAIEARLGAGAVVHYAPGCAVLGESRPGFDAAVAAARQAEVAIVVVGDKAGLTDDCTCGEARDRAALNLPGVQGDLVRAVLDTGTPVVLVLVNGRPLAIPDLVDAAAAVIEAWLPGEEGAEAVASVLFGDCNPGGRLPISIPRDVGQVPVFYNHKPSGGRSHWKGDYVDMNVRPLFPFGHGLSYTHFNYANLRIAPDQARAGETVTIRVDVTNAGARAGDEVVQLYIGDPQASVTRPVKQLRGFWRLTLAPGETQSVTFVLDVNQLAFYDGAMNYVTEPGQIDVMIGSSSEDIRCRGAFHIVGETVKVENKTFFSEVHVEPT